MSDELKELISKADKGDTEAQRELMQRGDTASEAGSLPVQNGSYGLPD